MAVRPKSTNPVDEVMRLASLFATARCVRASASKKGDAVAIAQAQVRVAKSELVLRNAVTKLSEGEFNG